MRNEASATVLECIGTGLRHRDQTKQQRIMLGLRKIQREHGGIAINRAINRRFRAVRVEQGQGIASQQPGGQGDLHLAGSLGKLAAVDVAHGQQPFAALQRAQAQQRLAVGDSAADDLDGSIGQRQLGAVAGRAARMADGHAQRGQLDELTIDRVFVIAAVAAAGGGVRAVAVGRPFAVPVAKIADHIVGVVVPAAKAGVQGKAVLLAGARDHLLLIIMPQRGKLHIGGIVAAGAGVVGLPADLGAGGRLGGVMGQAVSTVGQLHIGGVVAAGAGIIGLPSDFRAGRGLGLVVDQVVVVWIYIAEIIGIYLVAAIGTNLVIFSRGCTGGLGMLILLE